MAGSSSSNTTARSAHILHLQFRVSKASLHLSFLSNSTPVGDSKEVEGVLWALVFLGMFMDKDQNTKQRNKNTKEIPRADCKLAHKKI